MDDVNTVDGASVLVVVGVMFPRLSIFKLKFKDSNLSLGLGLFLKVEVSI